MLDWARHDGGHDGHFTNFPADHIPPEGPGMWRPTPPGFLPALQPRWGTHRPFALPSAAACDVGAPTLNSPDPGSACHTEALEVYEAVNELTPQQRDIALFWADDPGATATPPGHSIAISTQILRDRHADLGTAAEAYARVGIAVADAFIACWHAKYATNVLRPITYLTDHVDPGWGGPDRPLPVITPPFPEYPSGHSVQSAAAAEVLTAMFGPTPFTDHTHDDRGMAPRHFNSFWDAAEEAAISRLYGGIHFRPAIVDGLDRGRCVGQIVSALQTRT